MNTAAKQRKLRAQRELRKLEVQQLRETPREPLNLMDVLISSHHMVAPLLLAGEIKTSSSEAQSRQYLALCPQTRDLREPKWSIVLDGEETDHVTLMALRWRPWENLIYSVDWTLYDGGPIHPELVRSLLTVWMRCVCGVFYGSKLPTPQTQHPLGDGAWSLDHPRVGTLRADSAISMLINEHRRLSDESDIALRLEVQE